MVRNKAGSQIASPSTSITIMSTSRLWLSNFAVFVTVLPVLKFHCTHLEATSDCIITNSLKLWYPDAENSSRILVQNKNIKFSSLASAGVAWPSHRLFQDLDFSCMKYISRISMNIELRYHCRWDFCKYNMAASNRFLIWFMLDAIFNPMWGLTARY